MRCAALCLLLLVGCSGGTKYIGSHTDDAGSGGAGPLKPPSCSSPAAPPAELGLDPFYAKYLDADGIPVLSSASVAAVALERACELTVRLLAKTSGVRDAMMRNGMRVTILAEDEVMTDVPEYRDLDRPNVDSEVRSLGASLERPVSSCGEENLLCLPDDPFRGEFLLVHSIAHGLRRLGLKAVDATWDERLASAYEMARDEGLWDDTYAASNMEQYWAEGVQSWYDANVQVTQPDGIHNAVNTRAELRAYDPRLAALIAEHLPDDEWRPSCP